MSVSPSLTLQFREEVACPTGLRRGNMPHRVREGKHALQGKEGGNMLWDFFEFRLAINARSVKG